MSAPSSISSWGPNSFKSPQDLGSLAAAFWDCIRAWAKILSTNIASCPSCTPSMLVWKRRGHEKQRNAQTMKVLDERFLLHGLATELVERMRPDRSTTFWPFRFRFCWGASKQMGLRRLPMDHVVLAAFWVKALPEVTRWRNQRFREKIQRTGDLQLW